MNKYNTALTFGLMFFAAFVVYGTLYFVDKKVKERIWMPCERPDGSTEPSCTMPNYFVEMGTW